MATTPNLPTEPQAPQSDWNKPIDQLRTEAFATPPTPTEPVAAPVVMTPPATPAEPQAYTIGASADGGVEIKIAPEFGGEVFTGKDLAEASAKLAKSKADGNAYIRQLKSQQQQPVVPPVAQPTVQALTEEQVETEYWNIATTKGKAAADKFYAQQRPNAVLDSVATALGLKDGNELSASLRQMTQTTAAVNDNMVAAQFHAANPDFPATDEASGKLIEYVIQQGLNPNNPNHLSMAHRELIYKGIYQPATIAPTSSTARPTPPPMGPNTGAGPQTQVIDNKTAWSMPLEDLRKSAFRK